MLHRFSTPKRRRQASGIVTLLTDFGEGQAYVGAMKGVILSINPRATIIDICHTVEPQNVAQGAFLLSVAYPYFPQGTIHVGVVDPGVGTERKAILLITKRAFFLAPDNGLLSYVLEEEKAYSERTEKAPDEGLFNLQRRTLRTGVSAVALTNPHYFRHPVSNTFHGRDIFAPVAAHLSLGAPPEELGDPVSSVMTFEVPHPVVTDEQIVGHVIYVDSFGNLITDLTQTYLPSKGLTIIEVKGCQITGLSDSYAQGGELLALLGSSGRLEIAARNASAAKVLGAGVGDLVKVSHPASKI